VKVGVLVLFGILDAKVGLFVNLFQARSSAEGMRIFGDQVTSRESIMSMHPEDYSLFRVGEFDQENGRLTSELAPVALVTGIELTAREGLKVAN